MTDTRDPRTFFDTEENKPKPKSKGGRPKGSKTRSPEGILTVKKLEQLYNRVEPYLDPEQRNYIKQVMSGESQVDPMREMELLVRQCSILFSEGAIWWWEEGKVGRELASFADSLRMAIKDLADLRRREEERASKSSDDDKVAITDRSRVSGRLNTILGDDDVPLFSFKDIEDSD